MYHHLWRNDTKQKEIKKKVSFTNDVKIKTLHADILPTSQETGMMCTINGEMNSQWTCESAIWAPHVLSPLMTQAYMTVPRLISWYREAQETCMLQKGTMHESKTNRCEQSDTLIIACEELC